MKKRLTLTALIAVLLLTLSVPQISLAQTRGTCPEGTILVAHFDWDDVTSSWVLDRGYRGDVTIVAGSNSREGSWKAVTYMTWVIAKAGNSYRYYEYPHGAFEGNFSAADKDISMLEFCTPATPVTLVSFDANVESGAVNLTWVTGTETDNAGFNLYRGTSAVGPWTRINAALIPAQGDPVSGGSYSLFDTPGYGTFFYQLEDVDYYGTGIRHGPATVTVTAPFRRLIRRPALPAAWR